jgi:hypothetical protein
MEWGQGWRGWHRNAAVRERLNIQHARHLHTTPELDGTVPSVTSDTRTRQALGLNSDWDFAYHV